MKKSSDYSAQELAVMSLEQLLAFIRLKEEEQGPASTLRPFARSASAGTSPPGGIERRGVANPVPSPASLRMIGGL